MFDDTVETVSSVGIEMIHLLCLWTVVNCSIEVTFTDCYFGGYIWNCRIVRNGLTEKHRRSRKSETSEESPMMLRNMGKRSLGGRDLQDFASQAL